MGLTASSLEKLKQHTQLSALCSTQSILFSQSEEWQIQFWQDLLSFEIELPKINPRELCFAVKYYCDQLGL
jgi:hypothetical protein